MVAVKRDDSKGSYELTKEKFISYLRIIIKKFYSRARPYYNYKHFIQHCGSLLVSILVGRQHVRLWVSSVKVLNMHLPQLFENRILTG